LKTLKIMYSVIVENIIFYEIMMSNGIYNPNIEILNVT